MKPTPSSGRAAKQIRIFTPKEERKPQEIPIEKPG